MQEQSLVIRQEGDDGWRVQVVGEDEWPVFVSTKPYATLAEVVRDLQTFRGLLSDI
jgi:hypothetical protein